MPHQFYEFNEYSAGRLLPRARRHLRAGLSSRLIIDALEAEEGVERAGGNEGKEGMEEKEDIYIKRGCALGRSLTR